MIKEWVKTKINNKLTERAERRFQTIVGDCVQTLMFNAVSAANALALVEDGELTDLGSLMIDAHLVGHRGVSVASPSIYPEFAEFRSLVARSLPAGIKPFFGGPAGDDQIGCMSVYLLADMFVPEMRALRLDDAVSKMMAAVIYEDMCNEPWMSRIDLDTRTAVIEFANHMPSLLTLYGYAAFRTSLPAFAQATIPDITTFIRLRGLKR